MLISTYCDARGCPKGHVDGQHCEDHADKVGPGDERHRFELFFDPGMAYVGARGELHGVMQYRGPHTHVERFAFFPDDLYRKTLWQLRAIEAQMIEEAMSLETERFVVMHGEIRDHHKPQEVLHPQVITRIERSKSDSAAAAAAEIQRVANIRFGGEARSNDQVYRDMEVHLARMRESRRRVYTRVIFNRDDLASRLNPTFELWPHFDPCTHPAQSCRYDNNQRQTICLVCETTIHEVKGKQANCFSCHKPYTQYEWCDPSGCPHCNRTFVD